MMLRHLIRGGLNGNDIAAFLQSCPPGDLACIQNGAPAAIEQYRLRITAILNSSGPPPRRPSSS
jgi:hypothetical protein